MDTFLNESNATLSSSSSSSDEDENDPMDRNGGTGADDESIDTLYKAMEMAAPIPREPPVTRAVRAIEESSNYLIWLGNAVTH